MKRRQYLTRFGAGLSLGIAGLAGCGSPEEETPGEGGTDGTPEDGAAGTATETPMSGTETAMNETMMNETTMNETTMNETEMAETPMDETETENTGT